MSHPDLQQESSETRNELRESRTLDALFSVRQSIGESHHVLGFVLAPSPQLTGLICRLHALIRGQLCKRERYMKMTDVKMVFNSAHQQKLQFQWSTVSSHSLHNRTAGLHAELCSGLY